MTHRFKTYLRFCMLFVSDKSVIFLVFDVQGCVDHVKGTFRDLQSYTPLHKPVEK